MMKYNYIVLGSEWDVYRTIYSDLDSNENVLYIPGLSSLYGKRLARFLNSVIIRLKKIPFGKLFLYPLYVKLKNIDNPLCFILFGNWVEWEISLQFMNELKRRFPDSRYVWFMQDILDSHPKIKDFFTEFRKRFDVIVSYDFQDCRKYGLAYFPTVFSKISIQDSEYPKSDVYFLGKAKNRLKEIIKSYEYFKKKGLKADYYLVGVPKDKQLYPDEIHYISGMSYIENLKHVCGCNCVLEIIQERGSGYTLRINEALYFNKKIISNNIWLKEAPFYDADNIYITDENMMIDESFIENIRDNRPIEYGYKEKLSPLRLLEFIENKLT